MGKTILVVEDKALLAMELKDILVRAGFHVAGPHRTVESALADIARRMPDAALLDVNLGENTSEPIAARLREAGAPFAFVSGYSATPRDDAWMNGAAWLTKPIDEYEVVRIAEKLIDGSAAGRSRPQAADGRAVAR